MEIDRIFYIFGSFARKKQDKRKSLDQSSISAGNSPLHLSKHRPLSQNLNIAPRTSAYDELKAPRTPAYGRKSVTKEWECGLCQRELVEPRLLGCLHSFCTRCLQSLHHEGEVEAWGEIDVGSIHIEGGESGSATGSAGSGYESDLQHSRSEISWDQKAHKYGIFTRKVSGKSIQFLLCPQCGFETQLPLGGVSALPLNFVLLRKMMSANTDEEASVLCDLCSIDNKAENRCSQCLVSVCTSCGESHSRQKATARHFLHPLNPAQTKFCTQHPREELTVYCATCQQIICRDCCIVSHAGHALAHAARAAGERSRVLRDACERARLVPAHVAVAAAQLSSHADELDTQAARIEAEIQAWSLQYKRAVEAHCSALCNSASLARTRNRQRVEEKQRQLKDRASQADAAVAFAEELLSEAREDEILTLSGPVLRRLERVSELQGLTEAPRCELRFAPDAPAAKHSALVGRLLTRAPDCDHTVLSTEAKNLLVCDYGFSSFSEKLVFVKGLQDLRVDCPHEAILELRDNTGERIWCGGEQVAGYFRRKDSSARPDLVKVKDRADGTFSLIFTPTSPGAYLLAVTLNNKPIKGSPFPCAVRECLRHAGQYHCCAFCSSGGKRDACCGCGGNMPGYRGCGHGHAGWPGGRHWSCCGSLKRYGPCPLDDRRSKLYQFSL